MSKFELWWLARKLLFQHGLWFSYIFITNEVNAHMAYYTKDLILGKGLAELLTKEEIASIILHEIGHAKDKHLIKESMHDREYVADQYVMKHGKHKTFINALVKINLFDQWGLERSCDTHPSVNDRAYKVGLYVYSDTLCVSDDNPNYSSGE